MTLEIWNDDTNKKATYFKLVKDSDGINIVIVDEDGDIDTYIAAVSKRGMMLYLDCEDVPFKLDDKGRIFTFDQGNTTAPNAGCPSGLVAHRQTQAPSGRRAPIASNGFGRR